MLFKKLKQQLAKLTETHAFRIKSALQNTNPVEKADALLAEKISLEKDYQEQSSKANAAAFKQFMGLVAGIAALSCLGIVSGIALPPILIVAALPAIAGAGAFAICKTSDKKTDLCEESQSALSNKCAAELAAIERENPGTVVKTAFFQQQVAALTEKALVDVFNPAAASPMLKAQTDQTYKATLSTAILTLKQ